MRLNSMGKESAMENKIWSGFSMGVEGKIVTKLLQIYPCAIGWRIITSH